MKNIGLFFKWLFEKIGSSFYLLSRLVYQTEQEKRTILWYKNPNEKNIRFDFDLNEDSVVFDVGGYQGQWSSDIFSMYTCKIFVFEPVKDFAMMIKIRFAKNKKIIVNDCGLTSKTEERYIFIEGDKTSGHRGGKKSLIQVKDIVQFIDENKIDVIDLIKINIEGDEYDLLNRLIETDKIKIIKNILVQFHDFVPQAWDRMNDLRSKMSKTHNIVYKQDFVWERWLINK